jgi:hypothetical protein
MEENAKRLALPKRPQLALFFRPVSSCVILALFPTSKWEDF